MNLYKIGPKVRPENSVGRNSCNPYNRPKICPNATRNQDGITVINQSLIGYNARGIFVDHKNTLYVATHAKSKILILFENSTKPEEKDVSLSPHTGIFVGINGEIYFENGNGAGRIEKWLKNSNTSVSVAYFPGNCYGLFIDHNNSLYCSMNETDTVVKMSLNDKTSKIVNVAGTGPKGSASAELHTPWGIFAGLDFTLYVTDNKNNRIQSFQPGENNGTTIAGNGTPNNLQLKNPTDIILDTDGNLFIADNENHRVIRVIHDDYQCVVGCDSNSNLASSKLNKAYALRFDSHGNLFVADEYNHRIQKFTLATNFCGNSN
ncbi:unnamed protein product [Rotaria socialis]|uniref:NHL repeat-containing protein n=1 Tax=Rotaria socialis TaxID=392032 RepID=A0A817RH67_9BILA|nr:unnamed protein product [Rotaria socialis]CAF4528813.1 unnamed protein product [Rotaria socialis]